MRYISHSKMLAISKSILLGSLAGNIMFTYAQWFVTKRVEQFYITALEYTRSTYSLECYVRIKKE